METEHYIDGQHNGGAFNSFNLNTYGYCYQNPVLYVDPNGKQSEFHDGYMSPAEITGSFINEVRASFSNLIVRGASLFTKEEITPRYVVAGSGKLILVPDMPTESTKEKIVNSLGDGATIGFALLGGPQGVLSAKSGKAGASIILQETKKDVIKSSKQARIELMRKEGIPKSQQPISQSKNASGREYTYEVTTSYGSKAKKSIQQQTLDRSHPGENHWEGGFIKMDPRTGEVRMNNYGRPKLDSKKSKVNY